MYDEKIGIINNILKEIITYTHLTVIIKIGTSGYTYPWNKAKPTPFQWYVNQGFNSVEINGSFYRFPTESWIKTWQAAAPNEFTFSIKVHRSITHYTKLKGKSLE